MKVLKEHWQLLGLTLLVFALWQTPVMIPLKILVVFFHEASHAIMTILTGGEVLSLSISPEMGGSVWSRGGNRFLTLSSGYLGSLLIGIALLLLALKTNADRWILGICALATLVLTTLYVRDTFAIGYCLAAVLIFGASARFLPLDLVDLMLRIIGLTSMIYVPYDILSDTIWRSNLNSDARMLAEEIGGFTVMWGAIWFLISLALIYWCLRRCLGQSSNLPLPKFMRN
jgi:hypothetical protein